MVGQLTRSNKVEYAEADLRFVILQQTNGLNSEYIKLLFGNYIARKLDTNNPYAQKVEQQWKAVLPAISCHQAGTRPRFTGLHCVRLFKYTR